MGETSSSLVPPRREVLDLYIYSSRKKMNLVVPFLCYMQLPGGLEVNLVVLEQ